MPLNLFGVGVDGLALALEVFLDGVAELPVGDVVRRPGDGRLEAAADLVFALGAGLEAGDAALDAELDALVIAGLEVQAVVIRGRAPVASVEGVLTPEENRRGDRGLPCMASFTISASPRVRAISVKEFRVR
jgi:hypothetical protein